MPHSLKQQQRGFTKAQNLRYWVVQITELSLKDSSVVVPYRVQHFSPALKVPRSLPANLSITSLLLREKRHCTTLERDESTMPLSGLAAEGSTRKGDNGG